MNCPTRLISCYLVVSIKSSVVTLNSPSEDGELLSGRLLEVLPSYNQQQVVTQPTQPGNILRCSRTIERFRSWCHHTLLFSDHSLVRWSSTTTPADHLVHISWHQSDWSSNFPSCHLYFPVLQWWRIEIWAVRIRGPTVARCLCSTAYKNKTSRDATIAYHCPMRRVPPSERADVRETLPSIRIIYGQATDYRGKICRSWSNLQVTCRCSESKCHRVSWRFKEDVEHCTATATQQTSKYTERWRLFYDVGHILSVLHR